MGRRSYINFDQIDVDSVQFALGTDRNGKTQIALTYGPSSGDLNFVTPAAVTMWPRVTGDGNYGTLFGPADPLKAKYVLDLTDVEISEASETEKGAFALFKAKMDLIDEKLLQFVTDNQLRILGRKNLNKEEIRMLQIRTIKPKYDKVTGTLLEHGFSMGVTKYVADGMGGKVVRKVAVCDHAGNVQPEGRVMPGDVVRATAYVSQVYTGVGGDKFGIAFGMEDVSVVCQRTQLEANKKSVAAFQGCEYSFANSYANFSEQFPSEDTVF